MSLQRPLKNRFESPKSVSIRLRSLSKRDLLDCQNPIYWILKNDPQNRLKNRFETPKSLQNRFRASKSAQNRFQRSKSAQNQFQRSKSVQNQFHGSKSLQNQFHGSKSVQNQFHGSKSPSKPVSTLKITSKSFSSFKITSKLLSRLKISSKSVSTLKITSKSVSRLKITSKSLSRLKISLNALKSLSKGKIKLKTAHLILKNFYVAEWMGELIKEGKILAWGVSEATPEQIKRAHSVTPLTAVQSEYSIMERSVEKEVLPLCKELNIGFVAYSPMAGGFLSGKYSSATKFEGDDVRRVITRFAKENMDANQSLLDLLKKFAAEKKSTPAQISLAWMMCKNDFVVPIPGMRRDERLKENFGASEVLLDKNELAELENALSKLTNSPRKGLRYHQPMLLMKAKSDSVYYAGRCPNLFFTSKFLAEIGGFYPCPTSI